MRRQIEQQELRKLKYEHQVRFALFCAYQVKDKWAKSPECVSAIEMVELWLQGRASSEECMVVAVAAHEANAAIARTATYSSNAAYATVESAIASARFAKTDGLGGGWAGYAASSARDVVFYTIDGSSVKAIDEVIKEQWDYYHELLHCDAIAEKALLGEVI